MSIFIDKTITMGSGTSVNHHRVVTVKLSESLLLLEVEVESWASQQMRLEGQPSVARSIFRLPIAGLGSSSTLLTDLGNSLTGVCGLVGGVIVPDVVQTLGGRKLLKRAEINLERDTREFGVLTWEGSTFDTDPVSRGRIGDAVVLSLLGPFSADWTLADNSVRTLSGPDVQRLGAAMGLWVGGLHAQARLLKEQIEAATSVAEVGLITWPTT